MFLYISSLAGFSFLLVVFASIFNWFPDFSRNTDFPSFILQCSWGNKPTPAGTTSVPLPPPAAPSLPAAADLLAYQRAIALNRMASTQALMQAQQTAVGMSVTNQAMYDGTFQNVGASQQQQQQLMYY
jgi:nucleolysin TIA-1/TIAR